MNMRRTNRGFFWTRFLRPLKFQRMTKTKKRWNRILWNETLGFSIMIALSWLTEIFRIPHYLFGDPFVPNWNRAMLRTLIILLIWGWVRWITKKLLQRLHYLEEFLRTCSWCRKVCHQEEWVTVDEYFNSEFATSTSHGMCPECSQKWEHDFNALMPAAPGPAAPQASPQRQNNLPGDKPVPAA